MIIEFNMSDFHFLRPEWFYALIPLFLLAALLLRRKLFSRNWQSIIDPALMPHVLIGKPGKQSYWPIALLVVAGIMAIIAEAGPVWQRMPQPVYKQQTAMVIALYLSRSMDAEDIKPSRLQRAQFKLRDLLAQRKEGETALIVYANDAYTVTPLTDDTNTIASMIPSLSTNMLPAQGDNTEAALNKSVELMKNAGVNNGDILLITDNINSIDAFASTHREGYRVSVLGLGTADGAPIALQDGGFVKDDKGGIVISKINPAQLADAARLGGGRYSLLTTDDRDIKYLLGAADINRLHANNKLTDLKTDTWHEQGPWLLLLVIPLAAFAFRKGYLAMLLIFLLPVPQPAQAMSWDELWKNDNQRAAEALANNKPQDAATLFRNPEWQAAANYRAGNYDQAAQALQGINTSDAHYNQGNALAKLGKTAEAIQAYDEALKLNPENEDARHNKELLEQQKKQQQNQKNQSKQNADQNKDSAGKNQAGDQKPDPSGQPSEQNQAENKPADQGKPDEKNPGQKSDDKQSAQNPSAGSQSEQNNKPEPADAKPSQAENKPADKQQAAQPQQAEKPGDENTQQAAASDTKPDLTQQATEQWLRKIPDDPGGLLRRKFKYQYQQQSKNAQGNNTW